MTRRVCDSRAAPRTRLSAAWRARQQKHRRRRASQARGQVPQLLLAVEKGAFVGSLVGRKQKVTGRRARAGMSVSCCARDRHCCFFWHTDAGRSEPPRPQSTACAPQALLGLWLSPSEQRVLWRFAASNSGAGRDTRAQRPQHAPCGQRRRRRWEQLLSTSATAHEPHRPQAQTRSTGARLPRARADTQPRAHDAKGGPREVGGWTAEGA